MQFRWTEHWLIDMFMNFFKVNYDMAYLERKMFEEYVVILNQ